MSWWNCCCGGCCRLPDPAISKLSFSSLDGLHPVSFSDADIRPVVNYVTGGFITAGYEITPPTSANNASCRWPPVPSSDYLSPAARSILSTINEPSCCWAAVAIAPTLVASTPVYYHYRYTDGVTRVSQQTFHWRAGALCKGSQSDIVGPTTTIYEGMIDKRSYVAQRFLIAVYLKACWVEVEGEPKIALTAKVWYKDIARFSGYVFDIGGSDQPYYRRRNTITGNTTFTGFRTDLGTCGLKSTGADIDFWQFGGPTPPTEPAYLTAVNAQNCFDCSTSTTINFWQTIFQRANCNIEFIERTIYLDGDECSLVGTHTFPSGLSPAVKFQTPSGCLTGSVLGGFWPYPYPRCPDGVPSGTTFPTSGTTNTLTPSDPDFESITTVTTVTLESPTSYEAGSNVVMNWWTEDWTITIS